MDNTCRELVVHYCNCYINCVPGNVLVSWSCTILFRVDTLGFLKLQETLYQLQISKEVSCFTFICLFVIKKLIGFLNTVYMNEAWNCMSSLWLPLVWMKSVTTTILVRLNTSTIDELGEWCLRVESWDKLNRVHRVTMTTLWTATIRLCHTEPQWKPRYLPDSYQTIRDVWAGDKINTNCPHIGNKHRMIWYLKSSCKHVKPQPATPGIVLSLT